VKTIRIKIRREIRKWRIKEAQKTNKTKSLLLEKINKTDKPSGKLTKRKRKIFKI
jgi:hypothetical protein